MDKDTIWEANATGEEEAGEPEPPSISEGDPEQRVMHCRACLLPRVFRRRKVRHSLHFILSLGTLGLWLPVWGILILMQRAQPWYCSVCGIRQRRG